MIFLCVLLHLFVILNLVTSSKKTTHDQCFLKITFEDNREDLYFCILHERKYSLRVTVI